MRLRVILSLVVLASTVFAGKRLTPGPGEEIIPNEILVKLEPGANPIPVFARLAPGAVAQLVHHGNLHKLRFSAAPSDALVDQLAADREVLYVEPNRMRHTTLATPNDTYYGSQWALSTVRALQAWKLLPGRYPTATATGTGRLKVGVIDTGADCTHADFKNSGGSSTFSASGGQLSATLGQAFVPTSTPNGLCAWQDDNGHGTHVSGIIAAAANNLAGVSGLAYGAELAIFKVLDASGSGTDADVSAGIVAAADAGARVISISLGGPGYSQSLQDAITYAWELDAVVVVAAGNSNSNSLFFPAAAHHAMAVAATDSANARASFSNWGNAVDIAAPGVGILSTYPGGYAYLSGTSMATPHVSALAALLATGTPGLASTGIVEQIQRTASSTAADGGWGVYLGYGIINAGNAISGVIRPATNGAVTGQLTDANGLAVSGIVTLDGQSGVVDSTGLFRIAPVAAGTHVLNAVSGAASATESISVVAGADTPVTFQLGVATGTFSGIVSAAGSPVQGAVVQAVDNSGVEGEALTDATGHYALAAKAGAYTLRASYPGYATGLVSGLTTTAGGSQTISVQLQPMGSVAGVVRDGSGTAVANAEIVFSTDTFTAGATTDAAGGYSTIGLPAGTYAASGTAAGYPAASSSVAVANGAVSSLDFTFGVPITVTVSPASKTLAQSQTVQFTAVVSGTGNQAVTWSRSPTVGTISSTGLYTAPSSISPAQLVTVTATSVAAPTRSGTATVTVANVFTLTLSPTSVVGGVSATSNKVTLDTAAGSGGAVVSLSSSNPAVAAAPSQVLVAAGATVSPLFTITTSPVGVNTAVTISATYGGVTKTSTLTVRPVALYSVSLSPTSVGGGGSTASNRAILDGPAPAAVTVSLTSSNPAVASVPASVTVAAGQSASPYFTINTTVVSSATPVTITATYAGVSKSGVLTANPIMLASLTVPASLVGGLSGTTNKVTLNGPALAGGAVVTLSSSNPAVAAVPASVTVAAGQTVSPYFTITTTAVLTAQTVAISATLDAVTKTANLSVVPAALSSLALNPTSLAGGVTGASNRVALNGPAPAGGAVVSLSSSNPAIASLQSSVTVAEGQTTSAYFPITTYQVTATSSVTITATYRGVSKMATLTVRPPALYSLYLSPTSLRGGSSGTANKVTLDGPAGASGAAVSLSSSNPAVAQVSSPVTVPAGATSATFTITTSVVTASTAVVITAAFGGVTKSGTLAVKPVLVFSVSLSPTSAFAGVNTTLNRVILDAVAPPGGAVVTLSSSDPGTASVPSSVTVAAGVQTSPYFTITTYGVSATQIVTITATYGASTKPAALTVKLAALTGVTLSPTSTKGGTTTTANRITLDGPAPPGGFTAALSSSDTTLASTPATATIPAGATSVYFSVSTTAVATPSSVTITATAGGVAKSAILSVTP